MDAASSQTATAAAQSVMQTAGAAVEACRRTVSMRLLHGRPLPDHVTVRFNRTGLMVEVLDLPGEGIDRDDGGPPSFALARSDALGLGLRAEDFAEGVTLCHDGAHDARKGEAAAWHCTPVLVVGVDDAGAAMPIFGAEDAARWLG